MRDDEVSVGPKPIQGVPTSTAGFAGLTRYGPVAYPGGPPATQPRRVTSFADFEGIYGGLAVLHTPTDADKRRPYVAHAARAFFLNGGQELHVSRVFVPRGTSQSPDYGVAHFSIPVNDARAAWRARWPGRYGNASISVKAVRGQNVAYQAAEFGGVVQANGVLRGSLVEIVPVGAPTHDRVPLTLDTLAQVSIDAHDGRQVFNRHGRRLAPAATDVIRHVTLTVIVTTDDARAVYEGLETHAHAAQYIGAVLQRDNPKDPDAAVYLDWDPSSVSGNDVAAHLMTALLAHADVMLNGGHDGALPSAVDLVGTAADANVRTSGIAALDGVDEIAVVALPDAGALDGDESHGAAAALLKHVETLRYRIAVIDSPSQASTDDVRRFRAGLDSAYGALYYPWLCVDQDVLPPSGFVCGIYARHDANRGVHKAPANEAVLGVTRLEKNVNHADQEILSSEGINAFRDVLGQGVLLWGARTLSPDSEWKYIGVRRLLIYLEHSIEQGTQWVTFEPNDDRLWANIRCAIEDFLLGVWRDGALFGTKPEEAFFVRCDRTTMTQNDLDTGRLVCLVGVAPTKPAEFVIFRIGQWTADAHC